MPATTAELVSLLDLEEIEASLFRGAHPQTGWQRTFGGQVLAQALVAASRTVSTDRACHSLNAYFLRPGRTDAPILYDVENLRDGQSISSRRVSARQSGVVIFTLSASFHVPEPGLDHADPMPQAPDPHDCPALADVLTDRFGERSALWKEWDALEVRFAGASDPGSGTEGGPARLQCWVRTVDALPPDPALHQAIAAYLSDITLLSVSTMPHRVAFGSPRLQAASIDHAMWFHRPLLADRWLLYDQVSPSASHALGFSTGRLFQDGALVASCAQEGLIRVRNEAPARPNDPGAPAR